MKFKGLRLIINIVILQLLITTFLFAQKSSDLTVENHSLLNENHINIVTNDVNEVTFSKNEKPFSYKIGGEVRQQFRAYNHLDYGDLEPDEDFYLRQRYNIHSDLYINNTFHFFAQLNSAHYKGKNSDSSRDKDKLSVLQAFADVNFSSVPILFRVGRQELDFGSGKVFGKKDGPNNRQMYDGFLNTFEFEKFTSDLFIAYPIQFSPGFFDNSMNTESLVLGNYWTFSLKGNNDFDIYYFRSKKNDVTINGITKDEKRHSFGTRLSKSEGAFFYDTEVTLQTGKFGEQTISAWQFLATSGYRWEGTRFNPEMQVKFAIYSSDGDTTDNNVTLFRPVSSRPPVSRMLPIGPANIVLLSPGGGINISDNFELALTLYAVWRRKTSDGLYSTSLATMTREPDNENSKKGNYIASGAALKVSYDINKYLDTSLTIGDFLPGEYLKNTSKGKDLQGLTFQIAYNF